MLQRKLSISRILTIIIIIILSNVLCVGDLLLSLNNVDCSNLTQHQIVQVRQYEHNQYHLILGHHDHQQYNMIVDQKLDTTDKVQLEVKYRLPPAGPSPRARTKVIQVAITIIIIIIIADFKITIILEDQVTLEKDNGTFGVVVRGGSHDVPLRCRPFTVVQVKMLMAWMMVIGQVKMMFSWTMMIVHVEMLLTWIMLVLSQDC